MGKDTPRFCGYPELNEGIVLETTVIIAAAGKNERWGNHLGTVKHLAPIDASGETVIGRTVKMLRSLGVDNVFVVTHRDRIIRCVDKHAGTIKPENREFLTESILSSRDKWTERTAVLLGDVFFTRDCIKRILACRERLRFFGMDCQSVPAESRIKRNELYAFSFDSSAHGFVEGRLRMHSGLARFRDEGSLRRSCFKMALAGQRDYLRLLLRYNCPPKPPGILRKAGFKRSIFWQAGRLLFGRPRRSRIYGKLWGLYFDTSGIGLFDGDDYKRKAEDNVGLEVVDDMTQDVDMKEDYYELLEKLRVRRGIAGG